MQTEELYFNQERVDMPDGVGISSNYQIANFDNYEQFQASYTDSLVIPKTDTNVSIMRGYGIVGSVSTIPYRINKVSYVRNGITFFQNASAYVSELKDGYKINIYFQNNTLFEVVANKNISDLPLSNLNHDLSVESYLERLDEDILNYPLANYGAQTDEIIVFEYQLPAIKCSYIWNLIFSEAGFTYRYLGRNSKDDFNPFVTKEWKETRLTVDRGIEDTPEAESEQVISASKFFEFDFSAYRYDFPFFNTTIWRLPYTLEPFINWNFDLNENNQISYTNGTFIANDSNYYRIIIDGETIVQSIQEGQILVRKNNQIVAELDSLDTGVNFVDFDQRFFLNENDNLSFSFRFINENEDEPLELNYNLNLSIEIDNRFKAINFSEFFKGLSQKNFIKALANKYGLIFVQKGTEYQFMSYKELLSPFVRYSNFNALKPINFVFDDWSDKYHETLSEKTKLSNSWAQINYLKFQYSGGSENNFADSEIRINDETLKQTSDILVSPFMAPERSRLRQSQTNMRRMPFYEIEDEGVKAKKLKPFFINTKKVEGSFQYKQIGGEPILYEGNFQIATFREISMNNFQRKWLEPLKAILDPAELKTVHLSLNEMDIYNLNWFKLKYIKQLHGLFYLNKITNFTNSEYTKVELIKVRPIAQLGEFNSDYDSSFKI